MKPALSILGTAAIGLSVALLPLLYTHADLRDSARGDVRTPTPVVPITPPLSPPQPPAPPSGGINNVTEGSVGTGGNQGAPGGSITTGDEHVSVSVVNTGPTNSNVTVQTNEPPASPPPPACSSDRRAANPCPTPTSSRSR